MANRSKKVVISARIPPRLKAALDLASILEGQPIVKLLEALLEEGLNEIDAPNPFRGGQLDGSKLNFMTVFDAIWTEDEVLFRLRTWAAGPEFSSVKIWRRITSLIQSDYFKGDVDLFGDLNGYTQTWGGVPERYLINLDLIKEEWMLIDDYLSFLDKNTNLSPSYESFKKMLQSESVK